MFWLLIGTESHHWRFIRAEAPCWKGELQMGRVVIGWQRTPRNLP